MLNKYLIIICFSFIYSQGNYQILSTPSSFKNTFKLYEFYDNTQYSVFNSSMPGDINIFSATISSRLLNKNHSSFNYFLTLKNIDYGTLIDSETNYQFKAYESEIEFNVFKQNYLEEIDFLFSIGYLKSSIDIYDSDAIYFSLKGAMPIFKKDKLIFNFENLGQVINSYTRTEIDLPEIFSLSYIINTKLPLSILFCYEKRLDIDDDIIYGTVNMDVNQALDLYLSINSNRSELFYGDYIQELVAGLNIGISYAKDYNLFNMSFQNLGAAGYSTSFAFSKIIL